MNSIDINLDCGEYDNPQHHQHDAMLMQYVSSCNIACGAHAGNNEVMHQTLRLARQHNLSIGAHPSYPDRQHFGRRSLAISDLELAQSLRDQILLLRLVAQTQGARLSHVKFHGALYNDAANNSRLANLCCDVLAQIDPSLLLYGLAHSGLLAIARDRGFRTVAEAFIDRRYQSDQTLTARKTKGALLHEHTQTLSQALEIVRNNRVQTRNGTWVPCYAQTLCIHADSPNATMIARSLFEGLRLSQINIVPPI